MIRRLGCAFVLLAIWLLVLGWAARVPWTAPLQPQQRQELHASQFHIVVGAGTEDGDALRIGAVGEDNSALQSVRVHLNAADVAVLRYRFDGFPRTLELSFLFRCADAPDDVQAVTVPWPSDGWVSVDLRKVPGWHGEITELGFVEYPTPQLAPESAAFRPFRFDGMQLWSPSWRGSLGALRASWFGYTPWALLSVSALGPQREVAQPAPLLPFAMLGMVASLFAATLIMGWRRADLTRAALVAAVALWALLDLDWLSDLHAKHLLTEAIYAGKPWNERERLMPDQDIEAAAAQVRTYFAARTTPDRVLVAADSKYVFLKLIYLLLPLNAAPLQTAELPKVAAPETFVLLFRDSAWHYDEAQGILVNANYPQRDAVFRSVFETSARFEPVLESGDLHLYALRPGDRRQ
jgi:hypothetical protein